jgi:hypothetical protein
VLQRLTGGNDNKRAPLEVIPLPEPHLDPATPA